jgi:hypothetical protein
VFDIYLIELFVCKLVLLSLSIIHEDFYINDNINNILIIIEIVVYNLYWCTLIFCYNYII